MMMMRVRKNDDAEQEDAKAEDAGWFVENPFPPPLASPAISEKRRMRNEDTEVAANFLFFFRAPFCRSRSVYAKFVLKGLGED